MALLVICKNCHEEFSIKASAETRPELERKIGEYFQRQCPHCLAEREYHVNDVSQRFGKNFKMAVYGGILVLTLGITLFAYVQGWWTTAGLIIGGILALIAGPAMNKGEGTFNRYRIRRSRQEV